VSRFLLLGAERFPLVGLRGLGKHLVCFDKLYDARRTNSGDVYEFMVAASFKEASWWGGSVRRSVESLRAGGYDNLIRVRGANEGVELKVLLGVSFLDQVPAALKFDFSFGLQVAALDASAAWTLQLAIGFDGLPD